MYDSAIEKLRKPLNSRNIKNTKNTAWIKTINTNPAIFAIFYLYGVAFVNPSKPWYMQYYMQQFQKDNIFFTGKITPLLKNEIFMGYSQSQVDANMV